MTDDQIIDAILVREGSTYTNHPADRGGPTRYGITQATLEQHRGAPVTPADVEALTEAEARAIYHLRYIVAPGFDHILSDDLRATLVDYGVNSGPSMAVLDLQRALGVKADGVLGPVTLAAANAKDGRRTALGVLANRARFYGRLITNKPSQAVFAAGWMNRLAEQVEDLA